MAYRTENRAKMNYIESIQNAADELISACVKIHEESGNSIGDILDQVTEWAMLAVLPTR